MRASKLFLLLFLTVFFIGNKLNSQSFVHPGCLHNQADFDRMATKVNANAEPWRSGWEKLIANPRAQSNWNPNPVPIVYRGNDGEHSENYTGLMKDAHAAYMNALRWKVSGNTAYADNAVRIMNAWSSTLTDILGWTEQTLAEGIYGYVFANAGEIMRNYNGWATADFNRFKTMLRDHFAWPSIWFLDPNAPENGRYGTCISHYWANWGLSAIACVIATGILTDDRDMYNTGVWYYTSGPGNEAINNLVPFIHSADLGQWQESGRDQAHSIMGVGLAASICEMAWKQGDDLYALNDHRLYKGMNYVASYNLGNNVPYTTYNNCDNVNQTVISSGVRGEVRPVWEVIYNHYSKRLGWNVPYFEEWASQLRPEGGGGDYNPNSGGYDQVGFGTLTHTLETGSSSSSSSSSSGSNGSFNGTYSIIASHSGKALDTYNWGTGNGTNIVQWSYWGGDAQRFQVTNVSGEWHRISPVISTGQSFDIDNWSTSNGANLMTWAWAGGTNQRFKFQNAGSGLWRIINENSGKCIDIEGVSTADGANAFQWTCISGGANQMFQMVSNNSSNGGSQQFSNNFLMYPNPARNNINLDLSALSDAVAHVEIYSYDGKMVYNKQNVGNKQINVDLDIDKGLYLVVVKIGDKVLTQKLTIE